MRSFGTIRLLAFLSTLALSLAAFATPTTTSWRAGGMYITHHRSTDANGARLWERHTKLASGVVARVTRSSDVPGEPMRYAVASGISARYAATLVAMQATRKGRPARFIVDGIELRVEPASAASPLADIVRRAEDRYHRLHAAAMRRDLER